jgi:repressor LexA
MRKPNPPKTPGRAARRRPPLPFTEARRRRPARFVAINRGQDREQAVLDMIAGSVRERGYPPTIREIGEAFGIASTNGVRYYLDRLERAGKIRRDRWISRGIELRGLDSTRTARATAPVLPIPERPAGRSASTTPRNAIEIPLLGRVAAGAPILAEENVEDVLIVDGAFVRPGKHFALRVRGDSMKNAGILDGDIAIVHHDAPVRSGEIAVVVIGEEATVKRFFPRRDKILLIPENEDYQPIEVRPSDPEVRVAGKVVGVFRRLG